jgi:metal-dependent amidase/aminoacylase/carboxypeptidase family protein
VRTADVVAAKLTEWGTPIHRGLATTGVIGIVKNGTSSRAIGLRADMDALLWNRLLLRRWRTSESGRLCHRAGVQGRGGRRRRAFVLTIL